MDNDTKEKLKANKEVVAIRFDMPKKVHKVAMKRHSVNPRAWRFSDTLLDIISKGLKS